MHYDDSILRKINILLLRSLLIEHSEKQIIDYLDDKLIYYSFLSTIEDMLEMDSEFFLLNDYFSKMQSVIRLGSQKFNTKAEVRQKENELIVSLNCVANTKNKEEIIDSYLADEITMREYIPYKDEMLFKSMASDYYIIKEIQSILNVEDSVSVDDFKSYSPRMYLASMSFLMQVMPELYRNNSTSVKITKQYLKDIKKENPELYVYTKKVKKKLVKLK